jgi:hypothetical protein
MDAGSSVRFSLIYGLPTIAVEHPIRLTAIKTVMRLESRPVFAPSPLNRCKKKPAHWERAIHPWERWRRQTPL